jgi:hypothetical protein
MSKANDSLLAIATGAAAAATIYGLDKVVECIKTKRAKKRLFEEELENAESGLEDLEKHNLDDGREPEEDTEE